MWCTIVLLESPGARSRRVENRDEGESQARREPRGLGSSRGVGPAQLFISSAFLTFCLLSLLAQLLCSATLQLRGPAHRLGAPSRLHRCLASIARLLLPGLRERTGGLLQQYKDGRWRLLALDFLKLITMMLPFSAALVTLLTLTAEARPSSTTPSRGALVVRQHNTKKGEYSTIAAAVEALGNSSSKPATIFAYRGDYYEQVSLLLHSYRYGR